MGGFLTKTGSVLFAVAVALAWPLAGLLKDVNVIGNNGRAGILMVLAGALIAQQTYLVLPKPAPSSIVEARRKMVEMYMRGLLIRYYQMLPQLGVSEPFPTVRVNVMLLTKKWKGVGGRYMSLYYSASLGGLLYSPEEVALKWRKKNGTGGWAWHNKQPTVYDAENPELTSPARGLTGAQLEVVGGLGSVLSVPLLYEGNFVGVLNLDSREYVEGTKFNRPQVITLASEAATIIAGHFDPNGVAG